MNGIGWAVKEMQNGNSVCRTGWNGKGMFLFIVPERTIEHPTIGVLTEDRLALKQTRYVAMFTAQRNAVPWLCSQTDLLATDWELWKPN